MKVLFVKNFSVNNLSDVICIDEPQNIISNKEFKRIFANKAVFENINGINISSLQNVFYKSKNNQLIEAMNFVSDLKMSNVQVQSLAMVDGMKIDDAVRLKDAFKTSLLKFSNVNVKNIIICGRINECNLLDVIDMLQKNVSVKVEKHISSLIIDGNLHIKCTLNSLPENFLTSVSFGLKSITDFKGRLNLSDIKITHLNISSLINGFDVNFLLNDSVMQKKKNTGRINEIKVPEDVFLVYTDEKIFSAVLINETINSTDIFLTTINGIDLSLFLNDKVSLENSENISSILIFLKDFSIKGNLKVVNSINKINLNYTLRSSAKNVQSTITRSYFLIFKLQH
ncbi:uncharacterized protein CEXT_362271 [Caerostris extrusa]|uniref:Uncharacterized protein n=1 Tax=Caerostris extrusa TaxID=172846 RepID=A0AAV4RIT8_CAEEX|nr:uncharacterized protein CEXT_362271 [Caerostris extrusa]